MNTQRNRIYLKTKNTNAAEKVIALMRLQFKIRFSSYKVFRGLPALDLIEFRRETSQLQCFEYKNDIKA